MCFACADTKAFNMRGERIHNQLKPLLGDATIEVHVCGNPEPRDLHGQPTDCYKPGERYAPAKVAGQWCRVSDFGYSTHSVELPIVGFLIHCANIDGIRIAATEVPVEA